MLIKIFTNTMLLFFIACSFDKDHPLAQSHNSPPPIDVRFVREINPPDDYKREDVLVGSFADWLRSQPLKKDKTVYLYNGKKKQNQSAQFAILNVPVGKKDLQQCADAVMRLRAEYLFSTQQHEVISFADNDGKRYDWKGGRNKQQFEKYLETVFAFCGTASLEKQLKKVNEDNDIRPGDVFIKGGFPGHAMIVIDVSLNKMGEKVFMLAQSYMPAQDIHIVINPLSPTNSPWYSFSNINDIITPEWTFKKTQLKRW